MGETLGDYLTRRRLERGAQRLRSQAKLDAVKTQYQPQTDDYQGWLATAQADGLQLKFFASADEALTAGHDHVLDERDSANAEHPARHDDRPVDRAHTGKAVDHRRQDRYVRIHL